MSLYNTSSKSDFFYNIPHVDDFKLFGIMKQERSKNINSEVTDG